jgi:hypothetical protein
MSVRRFSRGGERPLLLRRLVSRGLVLFEVPLQAGHGTRFLYAVQLVHEFIQGKVHHVVMVQLLGSHQLAEAQPKAMDEAYLLGGEVWRVRPRQEEFALVGARISRLNWRRGSRSCFQARPNFRSCSATVHFAERPSTIVADSSFTAALTIPLHMSFAEMMAGRIDFPRFSAIESAWENRCCSTMMAVKTAPPIVAFGFVNRFTTAIRSKASMFNPSPNGISDPNIRKFSGTRYPRSPRWRKCLAGRLPRSPAVLARAGFAGADRPQVIEAVDACGVSVIEFDLKRIVADRVRGARPGLWFEHRQSRRVPSAAGALGKIFFLVPLVVAHRAGALFAEICKIVMADVAVRPGNIHARPRRYVNFHAGGLSSRIQRNRHRGIILAEGVREYVQAIGFASGSVSEPPAIRSEPAILPILDLRRNDSSAASQELEATANDVRALSLSILPAPNISSKSVLHRAPHKNGARVTLQAPDPEGLESCINLIAGHVGVDLGCCQ